MKKIINGKRYDTEVAEMLHETTYGNPRDLQYFTEHLYRKKTGEYFLYGEGGAMTKYAVSSGQNSWCGGEKIIPLILSAAQEWAEKYCDGNEYEKIFGEVEEDRVQVSLWISQSNKSIADDLKASKKTTYADIFAAGIEALKAEKAED